MEELKQYIDNIIRLNPEDWLAFSSLFVSAKLAKGDFFAVDGRVEHQLGFLQKGVIRAFYKNAEGSEYNKTFFVENEFFGAYVSLVTGQVNKIEIQALTDCEILVADHREIVKLYPEHRSLETLARLIAEYFYAEKEKREIELVLLQADARYEILKNEYPNLENRIPQYHIASYLGVTPTQLSRIRAKKSS